MLGIYEYMQGCVRIKSSRNYSQLRVEKHMEKFDYHPVPFTAGLWKHKTNNAIFALVVDNFCVKYTSESNAENFLNTLGQKYSIIVDRRAKIYKGIILK